jgi:hypothetical protein
MAWCSGLFRIVLHDASATIDASTNHLRKINQPSKVLRQRGAVIGPCARVSYLYKRAPTENQQHRVISEEIPLV